MNRTRRRVLIAIAIPVMSLGIFGGLVATGAIGYSTQPKVDLPDPATLAQIRAHSVEWASENGDGTPSEGQVVATTRNTFYQGNVDTDQPVYIVQVRGHFVGFRFPVPPGKPVRTGNYMTIVFDAAALEVTDWELAADPHDLASYGPTMSLGL